MLNGKFLPFGACRVTYIGYLRVCVKESKIYKSKHIEWIRRKNAARAESALSARSVLIWKYNLRIAKAQT